MPIQLKADNLERSFRISRTTIPVLRGVSLEISSGEAVFLCGASGAGKTTLLYTLAGLETPESGAVEFEGHSLYTIPSPSSGTTGWDSFFSPTFFSPN